MTTPLISAEISSSNPEPVHPPREPTPRSRRRAWTEPHVRFWWLSAMVFVLAAIVFVGIQLQSMSLEARLIKEGVPVEAVVLTAGEEHLAGKNRPPDSECEMSFDYKGTKYEIRGRLEGRKEWIPVGSKVPLRIDPSDPQNVWTGRTEAGTASLNDWIAPLLILPVAFIGFVVAFFKRGRLAKLWRIGEAVPAIAIDSRQTALAPRSRAVRLTPEDSDDRRIYTVFVPGAAVVDEGDRFWLLVPPDGKGPVVAASWFQ